MFVIGLLIGGVFGVFLMCLMSIARDPDISDDE